MVRCFLAAALVALFVQPALAQFTPSDESLQDLYPGNLGMFALEVSYGCNKGLRLVSIQLLPDGRLQLFGGLNAHRLHGL